MIKMEVPSLPRAKRGFKPKVPVYEIFNAATGYDSINYQINVKPKELLPTWPQTNVTDLMMRKTDILIKNYTKNAAPLNVQMFG